MNRANRWDLTPTIETVSGLYYDYLDPKPEQIDWDDVFTSLSQINRFGGQTNYRGTGTRTYSVGEHVLMTSDLVAHKGGTIEQQVAALHHDSQEAYFGDLPSALKRVIKLGAPGLWEALTEACDDCLRQKLGLPAGAFHDKLVKECDELAMRIEAADLKASRGLGDHWGYEDLPAEIAWFQIGPMTPSPDLVKERLRARHEQLTASAVAA